MAALHPLGRVGTPAEVADTVAFPLSEQAGQVAGWYSWMTVRPSRVVGPGRLRGLWVPKTCVTWADGVQIALGPSPRWGAGRQVRPLIRGSPDR